MRIDGDGWILQEKAEIREAGPSYAIPLKSVQESSAADLIASASFLGLKTFHGMLRCLPGQRAAGDRKVVPRRRALAGNESRYNGMWELDVDVQRRNGALKGASVASETFLDRRLHDMFLARELCKMSARAR